MILFRWLELMLITISTQECNQVENQRSFQGHFMKIEKSVQSEVLAAYLVSTWVLFSNV